MKSDGVVEIRSATAADVESLFDLSRRTISASYRSFLGNHVVDLFIESGAVDDYVAQCVDRCFVIMMNGKIVGYSVCKDNLIDLMMIDHHYHHRGLGTDLLAHVEEHLSQDYDQLSLESFEPNVVANNFYRKHGWSEVNKYFDPESGVRKIVLKKTVRLARQR